MSRVPRDVGSIRTRAEDRGRSDMICVECGAYNAWPLREPGACWLCFSTSLVQVQQACKHARLRPDRQRGDVFCTECGLAVPASPQKA